MGITFVEGTVTGKKGKKATVEFLVDNGAVYSLLPEKDWKAIGLKPKRSMTFTLADGTKVKRDVSDATSRWPRETRTLRSSLASQTTAPCSVRSRLRSWDWFSTPSNANCA
jgi:predicted aspartyl protease